VGAFDTLLAANVVEGSEQEGEETTGEDGGEQEGEEEEAPVETVDQMEQAAERRAALERPGSRWTWPPKTTLVNPPPKLSREARPELKFHCDRPGCTFRIKLDNSDWLLVTSPLRFR
jgi:hypothetical protein